MQKLTPESSIRLQRILSKRVGREVSDKELEQAYYGLMGFAEALMELGNSDPDDSQNSQESAVIRTIPNPQNPQNPTKTNRFRHKLCRPTKPVKKGSKSIAYNKYLNV
jgi:hypothetical protein